MTNLDAKLGLFLLAGCVLTLFPAAAGDQSAGHLAALSTTESTKRSFSAEDIAQRNTQSRVYVLEHALPDFLKIAARRNGYQISLSDGVDGMIRKAALPSDIRKIMRELSGQFDLKWHIQNKQLFVSAGAEGIDRIIDLGATEFRKFQSAIRKAGIDSGSGDISHQEESNTLRVNGSTAFVSKIEHLVESLARGAEMND